MSAGVCLPGVAGAASTQSGRSLDFPHGPDGCRTCHPPGPWWMNSAANFRFRYSAFEGGFTRSAKAPGAGGFRAGSPGPTGRAGAPLEAFQIRPVGMPHPQALPAADATRHRE